MRFVVACAMANMLRDPDQIMGRVAEAMMRERSCHKPLQSL